MAKSDSGLRAFGFSVKRLREAKGLTQEGLAEKANLDRTYISDIERGARNPGIKNVLRIAKALNISAAKFFTEAKP